MLNQAAVIGHPVAHSLSPAIHRRAWARLGLPWQYRAIDVPPGGLGAFMASLDDSWRGLSVTMPHKSDLVAHGTGDETVALTGVANTWVPTPEGPIVRNTDVGGYLLACSEHAVPAVQTGAVVGNGATARSAMVALARLGATSVLVLGRDLERVEQLRPLAHQLHVTLSAATIDEPLPAVDLLVSTVPPLSIAPFAADWAQAARTVFDSTYDPWPTPLADAASRAGRQVLNGLDLLAAQATFQVELMTGQPIDFATLRHAADEALELTHVVED